MNYDLPYLSGYDIYPKDGFTHVLALTNEVPGHISDYANDVLMAMQKQGYDVVNVGFLWNTAQEKHEGYITYK